MSGARHGRWRTALATVLIVLGAIIAPVAVLATWARDIVEDSDRYVATVGPLASNPDVQAGLTDRITNEIVLRLDVEGLTHQAVDALEARGVRPALASRLDSLASPLESGVEGFIHDQVSAFVQSDEFAAAWEEVNRAAHEQLVAVLTGVHTDTVDVSNGAVTISLATLIETVKNKLAGRGFALAAQVPTVNAEFTLLQSADLKKAQRGFRALDNVANWLPFVGLALIAIAVWVARVRRHALIAASLTVAGMMLLLGLGLNLVRTPYLNALPDTANRDAAAAVYEALVHFIRLSLRAVLAVALAVAAGAWLSGASASAVGARRGINRAVATVRGGAENAGLDTGRLGAFSYRNRKALRIVVIGVAALVYIQAAHPTGAWTLWVLGFTVLALLILEFLAKPAAAAQSPPDAPTPA
jgi:hypothetical protein